MRRKDRHGEDAGRIFGKDGRVDSIPATLAILAVIAGVVP